MSIAGCKIGCKNLSFTPRGFSSGKNLHNTEFGYFSCNILIMNMSICVKRDRNIRMSHKILQSLRIHSALCHIGTVCVPADVRRDQRQRDFVYAVILFPDVLEIMFPMKRIRDTAVFVLSRTSPVGADDHLFVAEIEKDSIKSKIEQIVPRGGKCLLRQRD